MKTQLHLTPALHGQPVALDDFLSASSEEGYRYEIIHGRLEVAPIPDMPHEDLVEWLVEALRAYSRAHPSILRRVKAPARVFLPGADDGPTAPEPDIACYREYPSIPLEGRDWRLASPFIVIEVLSDDTADKDLVRNRRLYLQVPSIEEYWILDPRPVASRPALTILRRLGRRWGPAQNCPTGSAVTTPALPGFSLVLDPPR